MDHLVPPQVRSNGGLIIEEPVSFEGNGFFSKWPQKLSVASFQKHFDVFEPIRPFCGQ